MDLPLFNIAIKINENWKELFDSKFELVYSHLNWNRHEYIQFKSIIENWVNTCVYNTTHYEKPRDQNDTYDQYEIKLKFPKYTVSGCLAIFRDTLI